MKFLEPYYIDGVPGPHHLVSEGVAVVVGSTLFAWWLFPEEATLVSVGLAAVSTVDSLERVLGWNRRAIFELKVAPARANRRLMVLLVALFVGAVVGYSLLALLLPEAGAMEAFRRQLENLGARDFRTIRYGDWVPLSLNNLGVLLFFFLIALAFNQGGVMLAIAWNASVWGATFGMLARRWAEDGGPTLFTAYVRVLLATLPHLAIEALGYVCAGLAGVFLGKALLKHDLASDRMLSILGSVARLLATAALLVFIGAIWEHWLGVPLARWVARWPP